MRVVGENGRVSERFNTWRRRREPAFKSRGVKYKRRRQAQPAIQTWPAKVPGRQPGDRATGRRGSRVSEERVDPAWKSAEAAPRKSSSRPRPCGPNRRSPLPSIPPSRPRHCPALMSVRSRGPPVAILVPVCRTCWPTRRGERTDVPVGDAPGDPATPLFLEGFLVTRCSGIPKGSGKIFF